MFTTFPSSTLQTWDYLCVSLFCVCTGSPAGSLAAHVSLLLITRLPSCIQFNDDIFLPTSEPAGTIEATVRCLCNRLLLFKVLTFSLARTPGALCLQVVAPRSKL